MPAGVARSIEQIQKSKLYVLIDKIVYDILIRVLLQTRKNLMYSKFLNNLFHGSVC